MASSNDRLAQMMLNGNMARIDDLIAEAMLGGGLIRDGRPEVITAPTPEVLAETRRQRDIELAPHLADFKVNLERSAERMAFLEANPHPEPEEPPVPPAPTHEPTPRCYVVTATGATPGLYNFFRQWLPHQSGLAGSIVPIAVDAVAKLAPLHLDGNVVVVSEGIYWKDANDLLAFWKWSEPKRNHEPMAAIDRAVSAHSEHLPDLGGHYAGQHQHILRINGACPPDTFEGARFMTPQTRHYITYIAIDNIEHPLSQTNNLSLRAWGKMVGDHFAPDAVVVADGKMLKPTEVVAVFRAMANTSQDEAIERMQNKGNKWALSTEPMNQIGEAWIVAPDRWDSVASPAKVEPAPECKTVRIPAPPRRHSERTYQVRRDDPWFAFFEQVREIAIAEKLMCMPDLEKYDSGMRNDLASLDDAFYLNHNSIFWVAPPYPDERSEADSERGGVERSGVDSTPLRAVHRSGWQVLDRHCGHVCDIVRNGDDLPPFSPRLFKPFSVVYVARWRSPTPAEERAVKLAKNKYSVVVFLAMPSTAEGATIDAVESLPAWVKMLDGHITERAIYVLPDASGHRAASLTEVAELKQQLTIVAPIAPAPEAPSATQAEATGCNLQ